MQNHIELKMLINAGSGSEEHHDLHAYSFTVKKNNLEQYFVLFSCKHYKTRIILCLWCKIVQGKISANIS